MRVYGDGGQILGFLVLGGIWPKVCPEVKLHKLETHITTKEVTKANLLRYTWARQTQAGLLTAGLLRIFNK